MVSSVDGPGPPPGSFLPVPTTGRSVVPSARSFNDDDRTADARRSDAGRRSVVDAVATPVGPEEGRQSGRRDNPFLERPDAFRRPLFATRPTSSFLAQAIAQDSADAGGGERTASGEAAQRYRTVQETVDRDTARRNGPPTLDILT